MNPRSIGALVFLFTVAFAQAADDAALAALDARAMALHRVRNLGEASSLYTQLLKLDPPGRVTNAERALARHYAPWLETIRDEFFPLKDVVAVVHPERPIVAYHLFWEDDIGYPADNEPSDHEIVWVSFDPATGAVTRVQTYFHGRILEGAGAVADANAHEGRAWIGVEWGFHGSVPRGGIDAVAKTLREHWKLAHHGRDVEEPLARGWPKSYRGTYEDYVNFAVPVDPVALLAERDLIVVTRWANAAINRRCLRYNFAAKPEWPWLAEK